MAGEEFRQTRAVVRNLFFIKKGEVMKLRNKILSATVAVTLLFTTAVFSLTASAAATIAKIGVTYNESISNTYKNTNLPDDKRNLRSVEVDGAGTLNMTFRCSQEKTYFKIYDADGKTIKGTASFPYGGGHFTTNAGYEWNESAKELKGTYEWVLPKKGIYYLSLAEYEKNNEGNGLISYELSFHASADVSPTYAVVAVPQTAAAPANSPDTVTAAWLTINLKKGDTLSLSATIEPAIAAGSATWKSAKPKIVSVDKNGKLKAVAKGSSTITLKAGDVQQYFIVKVK